MAHGFRQGLGESREEKVKQAIFLTGSPICASALSTLGGTVFLFACRTSALIELGILIFCVSGMALLYSMGFLVSCLLMIGPLPYDMTDDSNKKGHNDNDDDNSHRRLHQCDLYALCCMCTCKMPKTKKAHFDSDIVIDQPDGKVATANDSKVGGCVKTKQETTPHEVEVELYET